MTRPPNVLTVCGFANTTEATDFLCINFFLDPFPLNICGHLVYGIHREILSSCYRKNLKLLSSNLFFFLFVLGYQRYAVQAVWNKITSIIDILKLIKSIFTGNTFSLLYILVFV